MGRTIEKLTIEGLKSIRKLENFELHPLNVLVGAKGAGKRNFLPLGVLQSYFFCGLRSRGSTKD
jgi:predicted ATPase